MFYDIKKIASTPETLLIISMNIRLLWWKYGQTLLKWSLKHMENLVKIRDWWFIALRTGDLMYVDFIMETFISWGFTHTENLPL